MNKVPNLFVVGAPKSGTTSLVSMLGQNPDIYVPTVKEPNFFCADILYDYTQDKDRLSEKEYMKLYQTKVAQSARYRVDGSVLNAYSDKSIEKILAYSPQAKFLFMVRDPVDATVSMISQRMKYSSPAMREIGTSVDECWALMDGRRAGGNFPVGCRNRILFRYDLLFDYDSVFCRLEKLLTPDQLMICSYKEFSHNYSDLLSKLDEFLDIRVFSYQRKKLNESYMLDLNLFGRALSPVLYASRHLRKRIHLNGVFYERFRRLLGRKNYQKPECSLETKHEIRTFFSTSYDAMKFKNL